MFTPVQCVWILIVSFCIMTVLYILSELQNRSYKKQLFSEREDTREINMRRDIEQDIQNVRSQIDENDQAVWAALSDLSNSIETRLSLLSPPKQVNPKKLK